MDETDGSGLDSLVTIRPDPHDRPHDARASRLSTIGASPRPLTITVSLDAPPETVPSEERACEERPRSAEDASSSKARGDFKVLGEIGRGGMGVIYSARQASLDRTVALKMLRRSVSPSRTVSDRFLGEALVTGDLDHPNIVPVHDLGVDAQGDMFIAMKLVHGTPWNQLLRTGRVDQQGSPRVLSLREHLDILRKVCDAVSFAHSRGIVHRDLKPGNVMVGEFGEVLVMCGLGSCARRP